MSEKVVLGADEQFCSSCGNVIKKKAVICPKCGVKQKSASNGEKSKIVAGLLGIFLGSFGIHKFYLGKIGIAFVYILFCWTAIPGIIGFIEGILYLVSSDEKFDEKYNK